LHIEFEDLPVNRIRIGVNNLIGPVERIGKSPGYFISQNIGGLDAHFHGYIGKDNSLLQADFPQGFSMEFQAQVGTAARF
jgi:hypothetical protein